MIDSVEALNRVRQEEAKSAGQPFLPVRIGVGLNTGRCVVGNLGSNLRFNYSVLGDPVNVASRLEGQTKYYGVSIIIGSKTAEDAKEKFAILELDLIAVKGKTEPQTIYALLGREDVAGDIRFQELRKLYSTMLYCYRSRDWEGASEAIDYVKRPSTILALRAYSIYTGNEYRLSGKTLRPRIGRGYLLRRRSSRLLGRTPWVAAIGGIPLAVHPDLEERAR